MGRSRRERVFKLFAAVLSVALVLLIAEVVIRVSYALKNRRVPPPIEEWDETGWRSRPSVTTTYRTKAYGEARYSTDERGFRSFGKLDAARPRILVLGDSFTQAKQVSDGVPYFDVLAALLGEVEVFAYGAGGFGTLQQLQILEQFAEEIDPGLVLWQFSFNDVINNDYRLERASRENNNHMLRPYLEDGRLAYRHPDGPMAFWTQRSYLARRLKILIDGAAKRFGGTIEQTLHPGHPDLQRSIATTREILRRGVALLDPVPVVAFQASPLDRFGYEEEAFTLVCQVEGLVCVEDLTARMRQARDEGVRIDGGGADAHWSAEGHALAASHLHDFLLSRELLPE